MTPLMEEQEKQDNNMQEQEENQENNYEKEINYTLPQNHTVEKIV
jgi:hypothetical protein